MSAVRPLRRVTGLCPPGCPPTPLRAPSEVQRALNSGRVQPVWFLPAGAVGATSRGGLLADSTPRRAPRPGKSLRYPEASRRARRTVPATRCLLRSWRAGPCPPHRPPWLPARARGPGPGSAQVPFSKNPGLSAQMPREGNRCSFRSAPTASRPGSLAGRGEAGASQGLEVAAGSGSGREERAAGRSGRGELNFLRGRD